MGNLGYEVFPDASTSPNVRETPAEAIASLATHRDRVRLQKKALECRDRVLNAKTDKEFWEAVWELLDRPDALGDFDVEEMREVFQKRMNPISPLPNSFDPDRLRTNQSIANAMPECTVDRTPDQIFSRPFTLEEIEEAKSKLRGRLKTATGLDGVTYKDVLEIDNECLMKLINLCLDNIDAPSVWLRTELVGICKKGKDRDDPNSYRAVGLESCLLKFVTLLIHLRIYTFAERQGIIPPSQNGFREKYRTNNNAFILKTCIDKAKSTRKPLYVAFADLSNAFPSTDLPTLWLKLRRMGVGGKAYDWLRMIYARMAYYVSYNGQQSSDFRSEIGVLIGDTCSPVLWILYMADLAIRRSPGDITLDGVPVSHLEQADDIILMATSAEELQAKMDDLLKWCKNNFMILNAVKSFVVIFNQSHIPTSDRGRTFHFDNEAVTVTTQSTYVGVLYAARERNIFKLHYAKKADKAEKIARMVFALENVMGTIPPTEGIKFYNALVEPHLIHGCEIALDTSKSLIDTLQEVQTTYLRRLLGLWEKSIRCILHTETGLPPVQYRRLEVALGHLLYLIGLPTGHLAKRALVEAMALDRAGKKSWTSELKTAILALKVDDLRVPAFHTLPSTELVKALKGSVRRSMELSLQRQLDSIGKLYLIHDRLEPIGENKPLAQVTLMYRHYWDVRNTKHRRALAGLILSNHPLAVERLRWRNDRPPRDQRKCRLCKLAVETPEHALLECRHDEVTAGRIEFLRSIHAASPDILSRLQAEAPKGSTAQLKLLLAERSTINLLASYAHDILNIYDQYPLFLPQTCSESLAPTDGNEM